MAVKVLSNLPSPMGETGEAGWLCEDALLTEGLDVRLMKSLSLAKPAAELSIEIVEKRLFWSPFVAKVDGLDVLAWDAFEVFLEIG